MYVREQTLILLDVGYSMHEPYFEDQNRKKLDVAIDFIKTFLAQKVLYDRYHQVGLILMGSHEGDDDTDLLLAKDFERVDMSFIHLMEEIRATDASKLRGGEIFTALNYSLDILEEKTTYKKANQRIFLFTNGSGNTKFDIRHIKELAKKAVKLKTKINIIGLDFAENVDQGPNNNSAGNENKMKQRTKQKRNFELLKAFCEMAEARFFTSSVAISLQKQILNKVARPNVKFRGCLEITPDLKLAVVSYGKVIEEKFPTAKKYSLVAGKSKDLNQGKISFRRSCYVHDDQDHMPVDQENKIKGFYYGKQLVPIPDLYDNKLKYMSPKSMKLLCFADEKSIPRHYFMHIVDMVVPQTDMQNMKAFGVLVRAMKELGVVAVVRYCFRENLAPKLACLTPHIGNKYECFWLNILPTVEDIRDFQFSTLKRATTQQEKVVGDFIDALNLAKPNANGEIRELFKCRNTYNPSLHYYYQCLVYRAFNETAKLPEIDPMFLTWIKPHVRLFEDASTQIENLEKEFKMVEDPRKTRPVGRKYWSDILMDLAQKMEAQRTKAAKALAFQNASVDLKGKGKGRDFDQDILRKISTKQPISDFRKMINERSEDLTNNAIEQMSKIIESFIEDLDQYEKAIDCLKELRSGCVKEDEALAFNDFIQLIKFRYISGKHQKFWQMVVDNSITLIDSSEVSNSNVAKTEANRFIQPENIVVNQQAMQEDHQSLMADIE